MKLAQAVRIKQPDLRIVTLDIERLPGLARVWEPKTRYIAPRQFVEWPSILSIAWRWYGQRQVEFMGVWEGRDDLIRKTHEIYHDADVVIGYNSVRFDNKHLRTDWLEAGLTPPRPWKDVDLYQQVQQFGFESKSLDTVTRRLGRPGKQLHYDMDMAYAAADGDVKAQRRLARYNRGDVELTEWLADRLRPWIKNHPFPRSLGDEKQCNHCGSSDLRRDERNRLAVVLEHALYQCRNCGGWAYGGWEARAANTRGI